MVLPTRKNSKLQAQFDEFREYVSNLGAFSQSQKDSTVYDREVEIRIRDARRHGTTLVLTAHKARATQIVEEITKLMFVLEELDDRVRNNFFAQGSGSER